MKKFLSKKNFKIKKRDLLKKISFSMLFFSPLVNAHSKFNNLFQIKSNGILHKIVKVSELKKIDVLHARPLENVVIEFRFNDFQNDFSKVIRKNFKMPLMLTKPQIFSLNEHKAGNIILIYPRGKPWFKNQS